MSNRPTTFSPNSGNSLYTGLQLGLLGNNYASGHSYDSGPNGNDHVLYNGPTWSLDGTLLRPALALTGSSQYGQGLGIDAVTNSLVWSMSLWWKTATNATRRLCSICWPGDPNGADWLELYLIKGSGSTGWTLAAMLSNGGADNSYRITTAQSTGLGSWQHIAVTMNSAAPVIYLNGTASNGTSSYHSDCTFNSSGASESLVGCYDQSSGNTGFFTGALADLMYWSRVLTSGEIATLKNASDPFLGGLIPGGTVAGLPPMLRLPLRAR
jgi:hypothetical protein